jgi:HD-GYP domain-containing protein (c-di-GMP phosphodiesterase class II)
MSSSIDARDPYTQGHSERVARLSFDIAKIMHLSDEACQEIYLSGILHDIGKIGIPDAVLLKNGSLTDDEFRTIQKHPEIGYRIVERLGHMPFVLPGVLHHHERWDGKGYPHHLAGEAIPLMARVIAVADAFDAMTSSRPYRYAMPLQKASSIILSGKGIQWDADIVDCFHQWLRERHSELAALPEDSNSIIPIGSPMEQMVHAVMSLGF